MLSVGSGSRARRCSAGGASRTAPSSPGRTGWHSASSVPSTPGRAPGRALMSNAACPKSTTGWPRSASASCRCRCGSSAASTRRATRCRASISSGARAARCPIASSAACRITRAASCSSCGSVTAWTRSSRAAAGSPACAAAIEPGGEPFEVASESVVIAAGGINGDIERVRGHWHADWGTPPAVILNGSHRFADGRLHDAASPRAPPSRTSTGSGTTPRASVTGARASPGTACR